LYLRGLDSKVRETESLDLAAHAELRYPALRGSIYFQFSGAVTAQSSTGLFNGFTEVKHFSVFELVKLGNSDWTKSFRSS